MTNNPKLKGETMPVPDEALAPSLALDVFFRRVLHAAGRPAEVAALADDVGELAPALDAFEMPGGVAYRMTFDRNGRGWHLRPMPSRPRAECPKDERQLPVRAHRWRGGTFALVQRDEHGIASNIDRPPAAPGTRETVELVIVDQSSRAVTRVEIQAAPVAVSVASDVEPVHFLAAFTSADLQAALTRSTP